MGKRGRPPHPDVLTPRQQEVLTLVREGLSNREIAERLDISLDGAKFHVSEILGRTGVRSRREAAEWQRKRSQPAAMLGREAPFGTGGLRRVRLTSISRHVAYHCRQRRLAHA
jgi:DNA-binding CsgD family transcriptional regulator